MVTLKQTCGGRKEWHGPAENEIGRRKGRFASSTARHRHRISVKSKGADLVARKLATKFGEEAEAAAAAAAVMLVPRGRGRAVRHKGNRFCVNRDPRAPTKPAFSFFLTSSLAPHATALAILSSRICDHQHAKWIKFLDYTFRRPFFTRFRFLYPASRPVRYRTRPSRIARRDRIPDCFSAPTNIRTTCTIFHPCSFDPLPCLALSLYSLFLFPCLFFPANLLRSSTLFLAHGRSFQIWRRFYSVPMHRSSYSEYIDLPRDSRTQDTPAYVERERERRGQIPGREYRNKYPKSNLEAYFWNSFETSDVCESSFHFLQDRALIAISFSNESALASLRAIYMYFRLINI